MRTRHKVVYLTLIALVALCLVSVAVLYVSDGWVRLVKPFVATAGYARAVERLDARFPFTAPADGLIREDRLKAYLEVCRRAKAPASRYEAWLENHDIKRAMGHVLVSQEAPHLLGALLDKLLPALESGRMSLEEFIWIDRTVRATAAGPADSTSPGKLEKQIDSFKRLADDPKTPAVERKRLAMEIRTLDRIRSNLTAFGPNTSLCRRYAEPIHTFDPGERVMVILAALPQPRPGRTRVEIH